MKNHMLHERKEFANVRELIEWAADTHGERNAFSYRVNPHKPETTTVSYIQLRDDVRAMASALIAMGCSGKHIALIGKASYDWALVYYASQVVGAVLVPLDREWLANDLADTVEKADVSFLFCDGDITEKAEAITARVKLSAPVVYLNAKEAQTSNVRALLEAGRAKYDADPTLYSSVEVDPHALSLLVFTSGTTGKGKGVMLSQNAFLSDLSSVIPYIEDRKSVV